jgi:hypothetical protein
VEEEEDEDDKAHGWGPVVKVKRKPNDAEPLAQHIALEGFRGGQAREGARVVG